MMMKGIRIKHTRQLLLAAAILSSAVALAQTPPDAGALQRETGRELRARPPAAVPHAPAAPMPQGAKGATVTVRGFIIDGATLVPADELVALLADLVGQALTLADLERAAQRLAAHYRSKGWLARVYLPAQEIKDGVVHVAVIEGRLSGISVDNAAQRADAGLVGRVVAAGLIPAAPLSGDALERGLLLANDLPGIKATGILEPGAARGETRLRLKVEDGPLLAGDAAFANHGARSSGSGQLSAGLVLNPGGGDQLSLRALAASGLTMLRAGYALPIGSDGWRADIHVTDLRYKLGGDFAALQADGGASTWGAALSYPLRRAESANLNLSAALEARRYADDSLGTPLRRKKADALTLSAAGDAIDGLGGGGFNQFSVSIATGRLDLSGVAADLAADQAGPRTDGGFASVLLSATRLQSLPADYALSAALAAQFAAKNLDSADKFALGGPNGVRAYPVGEGAGDEGWLLNLELRRELGDGWNALALLDVGEVRQYRQPWSNWQAGGTAANRYTLAGAGLGFGWSKPGDIAVQLTLAAPLGPNPGRTAAGRNQDGSAGGPRAWLRLTKYF